MKIIAVIALFASFLLSPASYARTVKIDVYGMTCSFCVDSLQRTFKKMEHVSKVEVSLKQKKIRLETADDQPSLETLKQAVLETGFTPTKITVKDETDAK